MDLIFKDNQNLMNLIENCRRWRALDEQIKPLFPANLHGHFRVSCLKEGTLILLADQSMVANRLKMLAPAILFRWSEKPDDIQCIEVVVAPLNGNQSIHF